MKLSNEAGQAVYMNDVEKHGKLVWVIKAASGQTLMGRDRQKLKSRTFKNQYQAEAFLERYGYTTVTD